MNKRFLMRMENVAEPIENPIYAILFDRETGRYNLLNSEQTIIAVDVVSNLASGTIESFFPFRVFTDLQKLYENTDILDLHSKRRDILSAPISAYFEITERCNLKCIGCYQGERLIGNQHPLATKQIVNFLYSFSQIGGLIVRLTGKEPTTHKSLVSIVTYGKSLGLKIALNTNGVVGTRKIEQLVEAGISEVVVSLDGRPETHNQFRGANIFDKTVNSIKVFSDLGIDTRINMTVSPANKHDIRFVAELANNLGVYVSYIPLRNIGRATVGEVLTADDMRGIAQEIAQLRGGVNVRLLTYFDIFGEDGKSDYYHPMFQLTPCHARKNIFVSNVGNVYPCDHLVLLGDIFCGGNITQADLLDIWRNGNGLEKYRSIGISDECTKKCQFFRKSCYGGCGSETLLETKGQCSVLSCDRLCPKSV
ncbi:MAG: radical SAM protein [bacterium]